MQGNATEHNQPGAASARENSKRPVHPPQFTKVLDGCKQPIRGLWLTKTGRYYAQLQFEDPATGQKAVRRVPLVDKDECPAKTLAEAKAALARLRVGREEGKGRRRGRSPLFKDFADLYMTRIESGVGMKAKGTIGREKSDLRQWKKQIGDVRLDKIRPCDVTQFQERRLAAGVAAQTVNNNIIVLRNVLRHAKTLKLIEALPTAGIEPLKGKSARRPLLTAADIERAAAAAFETKTNEAGEKVPVTKNAQEFVDYWRLLACCGAREKEALALRWQDVDFERGQLTIGAVPGSTKGGAPRVVDFNPKLRAHLEDMATRLAPDSQWLFPSPQRGASDLHVRTFRASLELARRQAGMELARPAGVRSTARGKRRGIAFHDLRHHFISYAVMSGIDYMTIASWVGHRDGGVLIGKIYGHLADAHKKAAGEKLVFGPTVVEAKEAI